MNYPPSKRLRGLAPGLDPVLDPFEEDFTQDDLDEIDVIASQAITTATGGGAEPSVGRHNSELGNGAAQGSVRLLEAELKRKLQEVEEDIVMKSGEIRVLRDSLRAAQQEAETQRQKQIQIQSQHQHDQSLKEKELLKKVCFSPALDLVSLWSNSRVLPGLVSRCSLFSPSCSLKKQR